MSERIVQLSRYTLYTLAVFLPATAFAAGHTQMELASIDDTSLTCEVSPTTYDPTSKQYNADIMVKGYSMAPSVWDEKTGTWKDIKDEPLFVFAPFLGSEATSAELPVKVYTKMFEVPLVTNVPVGRAAIGATRDVRFEAAMELWYIFQGSKVSAMSRDILVNGIKACTVSFNQQSKQWSVSQN